ncbi:MAG TPA: Yip1 family protein [Pirellulales bacterium]|nr:Yip1 family protein [Pirellulales bacterium]
MAIEFPCAQCGKLLRVGDDAAGKQARCPSCGTVQAIPFGSAGASSPAPRSEDPFGGYSLQPAGDPTNPYAAPTSLPGLQSPFPATEYWGPRSGPPWERDGASVNSFFATLKQAYSTPGLLFREMRRDGGLIAPLWFSIVGGWIGMAGMICCQAGLQVLALQAGINQPGGPPPMAPAVVLAIYGGFLILAPAGIALQSLISSAIFHLCLMMVGGANQSFETTFRVVSYSSGCAGLLSLIPLCGPYIQGIFALVLMGMGFAYAHETSGGKATFAVLLPVIVCCGAMAVLYAIFIGALIANMR